MTSQNIWATFCNMKFKGFLIEMLVEKYQRLDRKMNIALALTSSGSIAAWTIWSHIPYVWGGIIAFSQVLTTIKPYFPYNKIAKELNNKCLSIQMLNVEYEKFYNKVNKNKLTEEETEQTYYDFNKSYLPILNFTEDMIFETSEKIESKANIKMGNYLKAYYNIDIFSPKKFQHGTKRSMANFSE